MAEGFSWDKILKKNDGAGDSAQPQGGPPKLEDMGLPPVTPATPAQGASSDKPVKSVFDLIPRRDGEAPPVRPSKDLVDMEFGIDPRNGLPLESAPTSSMATGPVSGGQVSMPESTVVEPAPEVAALDDSDYEDDDEYEDEDDEPKQLGGSVFDSLPIEPPASVAIPSQFQEPSDTLNRGPGVIFEDDANSAQLRENYHPAYVDPSIHQIDVSDHRFDNPNMVDMPIAPIEADALPVADVHIDEILRNAIDRKASDIHLTAGLPPMVRVDGEIIQLPYQVLTVEDSRRLVYETLTDEQLEKFESTHELDFAYMVKGLARFRFNVYMQRGGVAGALRVIPTKIPSFESLGLPRVIREISKRASGLILVTGPTGSGKSTTIASMIDDINDTRQAHILTIEDPIEYLHQHKKCMVNQRELHSDTYSLHNSLRAVLREDPDIILVGELRDLETIEAALTLAETGHLVFGTLHTRNAPATIDRIIDVFPSDQQDQIRVLLGNTLEGVVSQQLLPKLGGGRVASIEIMLGTPAIKNLIREGKTHQMYSSIETGAGMGMQTMDSSLAAHFRNGYCAYEECLMRAVDKESFARLAKAAA